MTFRRAWDADGWQRYGLQLAQRRHGAQNVQIVPDKVRGDAGIEFFSIDGCLYQCYAPEEVADIAKAASAMKAKGARDLRKLVKFKDKIGDILQSVKSKRWILLCPFLDDKDVVAAVRKYGAAIKAQQLPYLADDFEALVQSQDDFAGEIEQLRLQSLGPPIEVQAPTDELVKSKSEGPISQRLVEKLSRAFPSLSPQDIELRKSGYIKAHLMRENYLDAMRLDHAILWERSIKCLEAEEMRLVASGAGSGQPGQQITDSIVRIEHSLESDLPGIPRSAVTQIAVGTISDWLFRCPLDFPENE